MPQSNPAVDADISVAQQYLEILAAPRDAEPQFTERLGCVSSDQGAEIIARLRRAMLHVV